MRIQIVNSPSKSTQHTSWQDIKQDLINNLFFDHSHQMKWFHVQSHILSKWIKTRTFRCGVKQETCLSQTT